MANQVSVRVSSNSANESIRQKLRSTTESVLKQYFGQTLNTVPGMVDIFMALMLKESQFNVNAEYATPLPFVKPGTGANDYRYSTVIQNMLTPGNPNYSFQKADNEPQGRTAMGLTQVMGWNIIKGASGTGKCLVENYRPDLVAKLCISPGDSVRSKLLGDANVSTSIVAGLVVLESKYRTGYAKNGGWAVKLGSGKSARELQFPSRIYSSVAGYLGYSSTGDANNTTYSGYANEIVGGSFYAASNGPSAPMVTTTKTQTAIGSSSGPATLGGTGTIPGCIAVAAAA